MDSRIWNTYRNWVENAVLDEEVVRELKEMALDETKIEDAFFRDLVFGTGGLRGILGAGSNRMNIYTVAKATQGISDYLQSHEKCPSVVIGYDSRLKSDLFARVTATVFAANDIQVYLFNELCPVPKVSYAVRSLKAQCGVMITASHNPFNYNGYKVFGSDGCQITSTVAQETFAEIEKLDIFNDVKSMDYVTAFREGKIRFVPEHITDSYIEEVKTQSVLFGDAADFNVSVVYSPLNGTGLKPVLRTLREMGYRRISVVKEQEKPDGTFPTCSKPNPEEADAMRLGMQYAEKRRADLLLATDPDCDRVGIGVLDNQGKCRLLNANETGILLLEYICNQRIKHNRMPKHPIMMKTIVTTDTGEQIADAYGVTTVNVLTGFKYIGEQISALEKAGRQEDFIFGFEESYGFLSGTHVRDKDGVNAALLITEMVAYYKANGITLWDQLNSIYRRYGYRYQTLHSYTFEGASGFKKMETIMENLRKKPSLSESIRILSVKDYAMGIDGLPASNVIRFLLEGNSGVVIRPSGTEPKLKVYISVCAEDEACAKEKESIIVKEMNRIMR